MIDSDKIVANELLTSLSKSPILLTSISNAEKLTHSFETDEVKAIASDLTSQSDGFSQTFCLQKDVMTQALRTSVEAYATTITASNYGDLPLSSVLIFPASHLFEDHESLYSAPIATTSTQNL